MLYLNKQIEFSNYECLYDKIIPKNHLLKRLNNLVDFRFVYEELKDKYCPDNGRRAEDPVRLFKYLLLKEMHRMSDNDLVERSIYDMSFKYFLGYRPEDEVISVSLLSKFRKLRLVDEDIIDMLIRKTVEIAMEHGIIKSKNLIVDSLHTVSRFHNRKPHEVLQDQAKILRKATYQVDERIRERFPTKVQGENLDKLISYCEELLGVVESDGRMLINEDVSIAANYLREMLDDNLEHLRISADEDARVGHKSADTSFFGFKTHLGMTEEGIIAAAIVTS